MCACACTCLLPHHHQSPFPPPHPPPNFYSKLAHLTNHSVNMDGRVYPSADMFPPPAESASSAGGKTVPRLHVRSGFFTCMSDKERAIEVTLAASRLGASIVSKSGGGRAGGLMSSGSAPRLAFRRVSAAEYAASRGGAEGALGGGPRDRYAVDDDGAHMC